MARIYRRTIKKRLNDPDNHNGVVTHLEPDILEGEVKWALGSITMNKARRGDGILAGLSQSIKDDAVKGQFSCQSQRRAMPKNVQTTVQLCSFHMPAK